MKQAVQTMSTPLFISCSILFLIHQLLQKILIVNTGVIDAYLDNLLAMPIILTLLQAERYMLSGMHSKSRLNQMELIMSTLYISLSSELLFPILSPTFTADPIDVVAYCCGTLLYWRYGSSKKQLKVNG